MRLHKHLGQALIILGILLFLSACGLLSSQPETADATPTPPTETPVVVSLPQDGTPELTIPITATQTGLTLTIWLPPEIANRTEIGAQLLTEQFQIFAANHPDLTLVVEQKTVLGQGGILSYLRTGRTVAPTILPDLIVLPTGQLANAAEEELIYPLDDLLDPAIVNDLYPAAQVLARPDEQIVGYPFGLTDLSHFAYNSDIITSSLPLIWDELINTGTSLVFPVDGPAGATLALQFYFASGGSLTNEAGQPDLQVEPLTTALTHLSQGRQNAFISPQSNTLVTLEESWQMFQGGTALIAQTTVDQFLRRRLDEPQPMTLGFAPLAGPSGPLTPLVNGWAWAVSTADVSRRILAVELLTTLVSDNHLGEWSYQSYLLPARRSAFIFWPDEDVYANFAQDELTSAQANRVGASSDIMTVLSDAVYNVISSDMSPQVAAEEAVAALQP